MRPNVKTRRLRGISDDFGVGGPRDDDRAGSGENRDADGVEHARRVVVVPVDVLLGPVDPGTARLTAGEVLPRQEGGFTGVADL